MDKEDIAIVATLKMTSQMGLISRSTGSGEMANEYSMYTELLNLLDQYEKDVYSDWCNGLEQACLMNLNQPLLSRNALSGLISVNFNPKVINIMSPQYKKHSMCRHSRISDLDLEEVLLWCETYIIFTV